MNLDGVTDEPASTNPANSARGRRTNNCAIRDRRRPDWAFRLSERYDRKELVTMIK